jgi:putative ABC transport system permease protein
MNIISLGPIELALASILVISLAVISTLQQLGLAKRLLIAAARTAIQLTLVGFILKTLFATSDLFWIAIVAFVMLSIAGREVMSRQERRFSGIWGYGIGTTSMFLSSFIITLVALNFIITPTPWYTPQYAIPMLGMMLGNTMNSISLGLDKLTHEAWREKGTIEARLLMGHSWQEAILPFRKAALRTSLIPIINSMAAAGLVSLPGMMTGQILAGNPPQTAVKYQILIMFMITAGAGFGAMLATWLGAKRLFDERHRLRLDRLQPPQS